MRVSKLNQALEFENITVDCHLGGCSNLNGVDSISTDTAPCFCQVEECYTDKYIMVEVYLVEASHGLGTHIFVGEDRQQPYAGYETPKCALSAIEGIPRLQHRVLGFVAHFVGGFNFAAAGVLDWVCRTSS